MALYKRGKTWWIRFTTPTGRLVRQSAKTTSKAQALEYHDRLKAEYWRSETLGDAPEKLWQEAAVRWIAESSHKADHSKDMGKLRWLDGHLSGMPLKTINRDVIARIAEAKAREASQTTANRYLALVRAILRKAAHEWEWLDKAPAVPMFKEKTRRIRWLSPKQAEQLLSELPPHQAEIVRFALSTGLRQANILNLAWDQVDLGRRVAWIHPDQAKARRAIAVPLNEEAVAVIRRQLGRHIRYVFTYKGNPVGNVNTKAWKKALARCGISDFRWHDLRHTWASWHIQAGTPLHVLQELGGWECSEMVRRYAHLAPEHLAEYVSRVELGTKLTQPETT